MKNFLYIINSIYIKLYIMDILNFISWVKGKRIVTSVDSSQTLIPVGLKDPKRDDSYLAGAISVEDFTNPLIKYNAFTASIIQSNTNNPVLGILFENSLNVTPTITRETTGVYSVVFDKNVFNSPFDYCVIQNNNTVDPDGPTIYSIDARPVFSNALMINTFVNGILSDNVMTAFSPYNPNAILDVRVYTNPISLF